ncbi:MAG TPA: carboxypeptidase-like regulatory domain-containing protein, partial [Prolixibacteraceae bacterium]|nr:carboxypeptidase-like regulatory domain-containing protein [Prolixibacteraceae bacterium]
MLNSRILLTGLLLFIAGTAFSQTINVRGKVTVATTGESIPGANVLVKGTTTGTVTSVDGSYSINAPSGGTLVISFIGYTSQEVPIGGKTNISV